MAFKDTIRVIQPGQRRIKLFIDFWNVVINARAQCKAFNVHIHWDKLVEAIISRTRQNYADETTGELAGCYIFGSKSNSNPQEKQFVELVLDRYGSLPGLFFSFSDRVPKRTAATCSKCGEQVKTTSESGVDVLLAVEMIKHATMREHEYLALVSSDRDFIPLLSFLKDQGQRVLHVASGKPDMEMRAVTWAQVELIKLYPHLCTIEHDDYIVLTAPLFTRELEQILRVSPVAGDKMTIIDITDKSQISDKDLRFLLSNLDMFWSANNDTRRMYSYRRSAGDLDDFRAQVANGSLLGDIPCVVRNGIRQVYFNGHNSSQQWILVAGAGNERTWEELQNS